MKRLILLGILLIVSPVYALDLSNTNIPIKTTGNVAGATYGSDGTVIDAELLYINTLSSNAQNQLDAKQTAITGTDTHVMFFDGANTPAGEAGMTYNKTTNALTTTAFFGALSGNATTCTTASAGDAAVDFFGAGVTAVTDTTTCTDIEGTLLSITGGVLNCTEAQTLAAVLALGADANDLGITSLAKLEGFDAGVYVDMGTDGHADLVADTNIDLNSPIITYANATKPKKSIFLSAAGATRPTSSYAELQDFAGTNFTYRVLAFDTSSDEKCFWTFAIPDNFTGSTCTYTYYWTTDSGGANKTIRWAIDTGGYANDEAWKTGALGGTLQTTDDTWIANGDMHIVTSSAMTHGWTAGDMATVYLYRDVSGDDIAGDVYLIGVKIEYSIGTVGE